MNYEDQLDGLNEEFIQELFRYKKVLIECPVPRSKAYKIAHDVFQKALNGKYREYDYSVLESNRYKSGFLNNDFDMMYLYEFQLGTEYNKTVGITSDGNYFTSTNYSKQEGYDKCKAILNKIIREANEELFKLGGFTKKGLIFNRKGIEVPFYQVKWYSDIGIILVANKNYQKMDKKTGKLKESVMEDYDY